MALKKGGVVGGAASPICKQNELRTLPHVRKHPPNLRTKRAAEPFFRDDMSGTAALQAQFFWLFVTAEGGASTNLLY